MPLISFARCTFLLFLLVISSCVSSGLNGDGIVVGSVIVEREDGENLSFAFSFIGDVANEMSIQTREKYVEAHKSALNSGMEVSWSNDIEGSHGWVIPSPFVRAGGPGNSKCYKYSSTIWIIGHGKQVGGLACLSEEGNWFSVKNVG